MFICGAETKGQKQCQRRVSKAGQHCSSHSRTAPRAMWTNIRAVCKTVVTITETAGGVVWVYQNAWPYIEPLWSSGFFCPERFWWDSLAGPVQRGESPADIPSNLKAVLAEMSRDEKRIEENLAHHSDKDRERIVTAYSNVLAQIRLHYPDLVNEASGAA